MTVADLAGLNPSIGRDCASLWADSYACVKAINKYDFNDGTSQRWTVVDGHWDTSSKALVGSKSSGGKAYLPADFNDFLYKSEVTLSGGGRNAGIIFRGTKFGSGSDSGYYAGISADDGVYCPRTR